MAIPPLNKILQYLDEMIIIYKFINIPLDWITPAGMKISLSNRQFKTKKIWSKIFKSAKPITISIPTSDFDYVSIKRRFMPNLIHSLDASPAGAVFKFTLI